jgi:hypothetical protein
MCVEYTIAAIARAAPLLRAGVVKAIGGVSRRPVRKPDGVVKAEFVYNAAFIPPPPAGTPPKRRRAATHRLLLEAGKASFLK